MLKENQTIKRVDMIHCALCADAPCNDACNEIEPSDILRSIWFKNEQTAAQRMPEKNPCITCPAPCEKLCVRSGKVEIRDIMNRMYSQVKKECETPIPNNEDALKCDICGIPLENPFLLSSSVVASTYEMCANAFEAGWAGVCFKTICSLDIHEASPRFSAITGNDGSIVGFKNIEQLSDHSVAENMEIFRRLKENYPSKFILASIMGQNEDEWGELARLCEENGADAIELNFSCPNMKHKGTGSDVGQNPNLVEYYTKVVRKSTNKPILAKMTPNITDMRKPAIAAKKGGANGIAAINTIKSITNIDLNSLVPEPKVNGKSALGGYSGHAVKPIALRFISEMANCKELNNICYSGMGGIYTWRDAVEFMLLGCTNVQVTTAIMEYGYRIIDDLLLGLKIFMREKNYEKISDFVGASKSNVINNDELEKDTIEFPKINYEKCIGCGRCYISCKDGGHEAIKFDEKRKPSIDGSKCVGCGLCKLVCPQSAIGISSKRIKKN